MGATTAEEHHDLTASDGAGGDASFVFSGTDDQLPRGVASTNDTLEVRADGEPLPNGFFGELALEGDDVTFNTTQTEDDVELVVFGDQGSEESETVSIDSIEPNRIEFQALFDHANDEPIFGDEDEDPIGVRFTNLAFDAGSSEEATLVWNVPENEGQAEYTLEVRDFAPDVTATDEAGSDRALLTDGAAEQQMTGVDDAENLVLRGDEVEFPSAFEATLELDEDGVTFDEDQTIDVEASSGEATASVSDDGTQIHVTVSDFDGTEDDVAIIELSAVTFDAEPGSEVEDVTWTVGQSTDTYTLEPVQLDAGFDEEYAITRGLDGQPDDGATLEITSEWTTGSTDAAFTTAGETVTVSAPAPGLEFDTTQTPGGEVRDEGQPSILPGVLLNDVRYEEEDGETVLRFEVPHDIEENHEIVVEEIYFNTSGVEETVDNRNASYDAGLDVEYVPENDLGSVTIHSDEDLHVRAPAVTVDSAPTNLNFNRTSTGGDSPLSVSVSDTAGNQMEAGSSIVIGLHDTDIEFDPSQEDDLTAETDNPFFAVSVESVSSDEIVLRVNNFVDSSEGDEITLRHADGDGVRFDTTHVDPHDAARFSVQTNAGDEPVTQLTDPVAVVYPDVVELDVLEPDALTANIDDQEVVLSVVDGEGNDLTGIEVEASGGPIGDTADTSTDGQVNFTFSPTEAGEVTFDAINATPATIDVEWANIDADPSEIDVDEVTDVTVTVTDAEGEALEGVEIAAAGSPLEEDVTTTTDENGEAVLQLEPTADDDIEISAAELGIETTVSVVDPADGGTGGGGGGGGGGSGGGGGYFPPSSPSIDLVSVDIDETFVNVGDSVTVTVTVENDGTADGEFDIDLTVNGGTIVDETVEVAEDETEELTLDLTFDEEGVFDIAVNDREAGTVYVGSAEVIASETVALEDAAPDEPGLRVGIDDTAVDSIVFSNESATGEATVHELSQVPSTVTAPEGVVLHALHVDVPDAEADSPATLEIAVDADAVAEADATADELTVVRYDASAGQWESLETEVLSEDGEVLLSAETPGFSLFAVTAPATADGPPQDTATPTSTPPDDEDFELLGPMALVGIGIVGLVALLVAVTGARIYRQSEAE